MWRLAKARTRLWRQWADLSLRRKGLIVVAIPLIGLLLPMPALIAEYQQEQRTDEALEEEQSVHDKIQSVTTYLIDAESSVRGYLLTGRDSFLVPYRTVLRQLPPTLEALERLVDDAPRQIERLGRIKELSSTRLAILSSLLVKRSSDSTLLATLARGKRVMDELRTQLAALANAGDRILEKSSAAEKRAEDMQTTIFLSALLLAMVGGTMAAWLFASGIVKRAGHLKENAGRLVRGDDLHPVYGEDEIGDLGKALEHASSLLIERDISRRKAEEEIRRSEQFLDSIVENIPNMVFVKDAKELRFVRLNRAGEDLLGYRRDDLLGKNDYDFFPKEEADFFTRKDREVLQSGNLLVIPEESIQTHTGESRILHTKKIPITDDRGHANFLLGISEDITERRRVDAEIQEAKETAERANRAKSEFLSRMSHELRTPLNAILGFAQLLEIEDLSNEDAESVDQILKGGRHLLELINEVLDLSTIESGRLALSPEPVLVKDVLEATLALIKPLAEQRSIVVSLNKFEPSDQSILADLQRMKQVLLNLMSNAVKYNVDGGRVDIACGLSGPETWRVTVADTGPGIPPERVTDLFTPFDRLGAERGEVEGTGLGLALSQKLVELMGGSIGVETRNGGGSSFWVDMPMAASPSPKNDVSDAPGLESGHEGDDPDPYTILHVEDNLANLKLIERMLAHRPGAKIVATMQGSMALDLAREHRPDLILLDLHLPDMRGEEVLKRLLANAETESIPIIVVTADATKGQKERLLDMGAVAFLTKPLDVQQFLDALDHVLISRNSLKIR